MELVIGRSQVLGQRFTIDDEDVHLFEGGAFILIGKYVGVYWPVSEWGAGDAKREFVHKVIMGRPTEEVDHVDGNPMNCRKSNLRIVTGTQQNHNRAAWGRYPQGVTFEETKQLYRVRIQINGRRINLGRFKRLEDAIAARKRYDAEHGIISGGI